MAKKGIEQITITKDAIIIEKKFKLFPYKKQIDLQDLEQIEIVEDKDSGNTVFNKLARGTLRFYHLSGETKAGLNMPLSDAIDIRNKIMEAINKVKNR